MREKEEEEEEEKKEGALEIEITSQSEFFFELILLHTVFYFIFVLPNSKVNKM